jgi:hypothetical protein
MTKRKKTLIITAGTIWLLVGLGLNGFASRWVIEYEHPLNFLYAIAGYALGFMVYKFGFTRIVDKNLTRIAKLHDRPSVFNFMPIKSYFLIILMISMGHVIRHSSMPRQYLAVVYICMGFALFVSSFRYFKVVRKKKVQKSSL